jgi:hypothetical protein
MNKNSHRFYRIIPFLLFLVAFSCKSKPGDTDARLLKFSPASNVTYNYMVSWKTVMDIMGQQTVIDIKTGYRMKVLATEKGTNTLDVVFQKFSMDMQAMGMSIRADTDHPQPVISSDERQNDPGAIISRAFTLISGKKFTMQVNEEGEILKIDGLDEAIEGIVDSIDAPDHIKMQIRASLKDQFNSTSIRDELTPTLFVYPNEMIRKGDSWEKTYSSTGNMSASHQVKYTVTEINDDMINIISEGTISSKGEMAIQGKISGNLLIDSRSGLVTKAEFRNEVQGKVEDMQINRTSDGTTIGTMQ